MKPFHLVNAFTTDPFGGNPAAVMVLESPNWPDVAWMQGVAAQFNLSETAFVLRKAGEPFGLRWMTPTAEVDLCGHATLASAHVLWATGTLEPTAAASFDTRSGRLTCRRREDGRIGMDFPSIPVRPIQAPRPALGALGLDHALAATDGTYLLIEVETETAVRAIRPDFDVLSQLEEWGTIVTARASWGGDFVSRFFAPRKGVSEDPVTGSAHCRLAPYWAAKLGKTVLNARQVSPRGGDLEVIHHGERVEILGRALTVGRGELSI